jgi:hypothetical protein
VVAKIGNSAKNIYLCPRKIKRIKKIAMRIEDVIVEGLVFKGKKDGPKKDENKVKTKAKKATYIHGTHGSGAAKMKAEIRRKRANRHKNK